jgi:hypothetical protein
VRVTLTKYAETKAVLRHFGRDQVAAVLAALNLGEREWREAEEHWRRGIDDELAAGVSSGAETFDEVFHRVRGELLADPPALAALVPRGLGFVERAPEALAAPSPPTPGVPMPAAPKPVVTYAAPRLMDSTLPGMPAPVLDDAIPFAGSRAAPPSALDELPPVAPGDLDRTDPLGQQALVVDTPFAPSSEQSPPSSAPLSRPRELTLEQYASLQAELRVSPERGEAVYARYGLGDAAVRRATEESWSARLGGDPRLRGRWDELVAHYIQWLRQGR